MNQEKVGNKVLFYDTYALYAIVKGEESYRNYISNYKILTNLMNVYELYYILIKENENKLAEEFFDKLINFCVKIEPNIVKEAAAFRLENIKKKFSYLDCLGYVTARSLKVKFLTGDEGFRDISGVEFVK
ncbi:PIN domain nuclease [Candidatus Pacearchaeota archaeon CG_4_10_14_0_2_um_filter_05_32_18]|nr:MAG: hypothetical protein AUJ62_03885 [Candidatus Pacearchaeota archaeon CG1_02_32_21]PIZ83851.1 MAG: PIN domain nuclease [Candidatus Pacearchaeota archaeon CG_4_10_14_0_2_um_filter_05_32_18]